MTEQTIFHTYYREILVCDNRNLLSSFVSFLPVSWPFSGSGCCEQKSCKFRGTEEWTKENQDMSSYPSVFSSESSSFLPLFSYSEWIKSLVYYIAHEILKTKTQFAGILHFKQQNCLCENFNTNVHLLMDF